MPVLYQGIKYGCIITYYSMFDSVKTFFDYRSMVWNLVKREVRGRYKGSILGFIWNFLTPLVQIIVYIVVFTAIFKPNIDNYAIFLTSGMILWIFFSESIIESSWVLVGNSEMLKKIYFPRSVLPIALIISKLVNFIIMMIIYFVIVITMNFGVSLEALLTFVPFIVLFIVFMIGFALIVSALDVYFRDVQYILTVLMMALVWMTPIMYTRDSIDSEILSTILDCNPMTYYVEWFHDMLYWKCIPDFETVIICAIISLVFFALGCIVFKILEKDFAEVL